MNDFKSQLIQFLTEINFTDNKEAFVDSFLTLCHQKALLELFQTLPQDQVHALQATLSQNDTAQTENALKPYQQQYTQALQNAVQSNLEGMLNAVWPTLTAEELAKFNTSYPPDQTEQKI